MSNETKSKRWGTLIARVLMGLLFLAAGLFGLIHAPQPKDMNGMPAAALALFEAFKDSHYMMPLVSGTEAVGGALLLINRFAPLGVVLLAPVVVNIMLFHIFLAPSGIPVAIVVLALELFLAWSYRAAFLPMLAARN